MCIRDRTYAELYAEVQRFANVLKALGIRKGDRVAVYMGTVSYTHLITHRPPDLDPRASAQY